MGKKNPIKQVVSAAVDTSHALTRETARAIGADGIVKGVEQLQGIENRISNEALDFASGSAARKKKEAKEGEAIAAQRQAVAAGEAASRQAAAENARIEGERMSAGSASRTLLTGPGGLEDEEGVGASRRLLQGRRRA